MKKLFIFLFMLSIIGLFAAVNYNNAKSEGEPVKKQTTVITKKVIKADDIENTCSDIVQARIAGCYGIDPSDVCCLTVGGNYTIISTSYVGTYTAVACGSGCTTITIYPNGGSTPCIFNIPYDWPC